MLPLYEGIGVMDANQFPRNSMEFDEFFGPDGLVEEAVVEDHRRCAVLRGCPLEEGAGGEEILFADVLLAVFGDEGFFEE